jgi:hypothetical protein
MKFREIEEIVPYAECSHRKGTHFVALKFPKAGCHDCIGDNSQAQLRMSNFVVKLGKHPGSTGTVGA